MEFTPSTVASFLYGGISDAIHRLLKKPEDMWDDYDSTQVYRIKEAVEWYREYCVLSSTHLEAECEKLNELISDKFIYNGDRYLRYTFRYIPVVDKVVEYTDQIIDKSVLSYKDLEIGKIVKAFNGEYMKITEVYKTPDKKYGYFIGESLSIDELLNLKGGLGKK